MDPIFIKLTSFLVGTKSFVTHQVDIIISGIPEIKTIITNQSHWMEIQVIYTKIHSIHLMFKNMNFIHY